MFRKQSQMRFNLINLLFQKLLLDYQFKRIEKEEIMLKEKEKEIINQLNHEVLTYNNKIKS